MSEGQISKTKLVVCCIGAAALGAVLWHFLAPHFGGDDSPIVVRDGGSIILDSQGAKSLADFIDVDDDIIVHPVGTGKISKITGTKANVDYLTTCKPNVRCKIILDYEDNPPTGDIRRVVIASGQNGDGLSIRSKERPFNVANSNWDRSNRKRWRYRDLDETVKVRKVMVQGTNLNTNDDPVSLCGVGVDCKKVVVIYTH
jgi:hypothetical protein